MEEEIKQTHRDAPVGGSRVKRGQEVIFGEQTREYSLLLIFLDDLLCNMFVLSL